VVSKGENLHKTFGTEYHDEDHIEAVEDHRKLFGLLIVVHSHRQHVETDEQHDQHIELGVCADLKNYRLWLPLENKFKIILNQTPEIIVNN